MAGRLRRRLTTPLVPALLSLILLACCPVPTGTASDTSFAAELVALGANGAIAVLDSGRRVRLDIPAGLTHERLSVGQRVYVEGILAGGAVAVRRIALIGPSIVQSTRDATAAAPMTPASVPRSAGRSSGTG